ncbi:AtpZ/AtpI family protein [Garciella nitratireducens]|uniref:Putative F0F1-ATPase subunit Ca2+/Mg2+ transporter n=1 Tax=Garciella nitratireducens DSM 15102 TaxID=1121911 RepID=A0A1T4MJR4_9FIRM|nr:AtpZ/AtpI family protein [Garciella nitratireducens]RBP37802.1 putative F0F1-ATPase subunit (Ca2+/Mg2+ transporter) [Garciella nitratireducens]SJZ67222.1 Putative F0F1-ATPase subunit Ca2+/Mg2+ transporter [Garciella nitratireducens DSM 15102]
MGKKNSSPLQNLVYLTQLGFTMIVPIIGGVLLGNFIDRKFFAGHFFLMLCTIIGTLAAFRNLLIVGGKASQKKENHRNEE